MRIQDLEMRDLGVSGPRFEVLGVWGSRYGV
jgi:hypothetical protein